MNFFVKYQGISLGFFIKNRNSYKILNILRIIGIETYGITVSPGCERVSRYDWKDGKPFWVNYKPCFWNKHSDNDIVLNEDGKLTLKNKEIANTFNDYFDTIVENLNLEHWDEESNSHSVINHRNDVNNVIKKYINHPRIKNIKKKTQKYQWISISPSNCGWGYESN